MGRRSQTSRADRGRLNPAPQVKTGSTGLRFTDTVPLSETGWKVSGTGAAVTAEVFKNVLSQLAGIYIYTEWHSGADDTSVDNIHMIGP
jgi:hypothetical protein